VNGKERPSTARPQIIDKVGFRGFVRSRSLGRGKPEEVTAFLGEGAGRPWPEECRVTRKPQTIVSRRGVPRGRRCFAAALRRQAPGTFRRITDYAVLAVGRRTSTGR